LLHIGNHARRIRLGLIHLAGGKKFVIKTGGLSV
jgi:hypothetical protein